MLGCGRATWKLARWESQVRRKAGEPVGKPMETALAVGLIHHGKIYGKQCYYGING